MLPAFGLSLLFSIALCVHVVRTNQAMYWLMIILMLQPLGGLVYSGRHRGAVDLREHDGPSRGDGSPRNSGSRPGVSRGRRRQ